MRISRYRNRGWAFGSVSVYFCDMCLFLAQVSLMSASDRRLLEYFFLIWYTPCRTRPLRESRLRSDELHAGF
ncbi:hypothetical protein F5Y17DRAFT_421441 [Xylariaceae sp. FL0594]|nr:hypothetical protein F5Y17DRAFT_421441 [Xylariaceae sp. FL0594]